MCLWELKVVALIRLSEFGYGGGGSWRKVEEEEEEEDDEERTWGKREYASAWVKECEVNEVKWVWVCLEREEVMRFSWSLGEDIFLFVVIKGTKWLIKGFILDKP